MEKKSEVISCRRRENMTQEQCLLHGGVVTAIADVTCGYTALGLSDHDSNHKAPENTRLAHLQFQLS